MGNTLSADAFHGLGEAVSRGKEELHGELLMQLEEYVKTDRDALLQMTLDNEAVAVKALVDSARCRIPAFQLDTARILTALMRPSGPEDNNAHAMQKAVARYRGISPFVLMGISTSVEHQIAGANALSVLAEQPMARLDIDEAGGMKPLIILMLSLDENLQLAASAALANMCADHRGQDEAEHVPAIIRKRCTLYGGIETMIRLMVLERTPKRVMVEIARLCGNMAESEAARHRIATQTTLGHFGLEMILRHVRACREDPSPESKQIMGHLTRALSHLAKEDANARLFCMPLFDDLGMQRQANEYRTRIQQQRGGSMTDDDELTSGLGGPENKPHFVGVNLLIDIAGSSADPAEDTNDEEGAGEKTGLLPAAGVTGNNDSGKSTAEEHSVNASVALLHLSLDEATQKVILDADGLRPLMHLAETTVGSGGEQDQVALQRRAIWSLLTIASGSSMCRTGAGIQRTAKTAQYLVLPLIRVLRVATDSVVRRLCARALSFLAMRADCQRAIIVGDEAPLEPGSGKAPAGVKLLMEVSTRGQGEDMAQKEATRTLANLCMVREAEALEMLRASGVSDLFQRLVENTQSGSLTIQGHLAIANLDPPPWTMEHEQFRTMPLYDMIHDFCGMTEQTNQQLQCKAAGALAVLAQASCTHFKIIQEDGIQRLVRLLRSSLVSIAAQREAASALAQLSMHPGGMVLWLKFESPNRIATDTAGECVPVPRGAVPHVRDVGYRECELPIGYSSRPSASPESGGSDDEDEDEDEDDEYSEGRRTARSTSHRSASAASATAAAEFAFKGKVSPAPGRSKRSTRSLEQIRAAGEWGASFGPDSTIILGREGAALPEEYSISVWFHGSGAGPGGDGDRFQTLVECVNGDRVACVHPGANGRTRLLGCFQRERQQFMACGLSMDDLAPSTWHHMVVVAARGQTSFYVDGEEAGELPAFATTSPILSVGNAVATGEPFGTIADFRVFPRALNIRERVLNPHAPFNALPWTPSALRGGEDNLSYDSTQVVRGGAVPALVSLLPDREPEVMLPAVKAIANLALHAENRVKLLEESALQPLVTLSNSDIEELRREACRALVNLF